MKDIVILKFPTEGTIEVLENDKTISDATAEQLVKWLKKRDENVSIVISSVDGKISDLLMRMKEDENPRWSRRFR